MIVLAVFILSAENWYMHVVHPKDFRECSGIKRCIRDIFGPMGIPVSTFIIGCLALMGIQLFWFGHDSFVYFAGLVMGNAYADFLVIKYVRSTRSTTSSNQCK